ncbi:uncharacterized protein DS421_20g695090 [Arachis hypogaea]|uniref:Uncharacterized protein n=1 Tax=Arachis hypogaea TaxID=3818 RepID=A0A444X3J5_ARAHY|nr:uncharacterized protein DS421_20g695090 [Arachis hypogaea]RYQ84229.1 hypothetical protein Ahy_B10g103325 isoform D [Arachis hypogaea]
MGKMEQLLEDIVLQTLRLMRQKDATKLSCGDDGMEAKEAMPCLVELAVVMDAFSCNMAEYVITSETIFAEDEEMRFDEDEEIDLGEDIQEQKESVIILDGIG